MPSGGYELLGGEGPIAALHISFDREEFLP